VSYRGDEGQRGETSVPNFDVRVLTASDWAALRDLRLFALRTEPAVFSASHAQAAEQPPDWWQSCAQGEDHQVFGAYAGAAMIGLIGAFTSPDDPSGGTAWMGMLFVHPAWRGQGVSALLFTAALDWVRARKRFHSVVVGHRASNIASQRAILLHGFREVRRETHLWPDGVTEDELGYALLLSPQTA
jgi:RimJ/RimL family protein N-acetyltransferase